MFTNDDLLQLQARGISPESAETQLRHFREGFPFIRLNRPATPGDGIRVLGEDEKSEAIRFYNRHNGNLSILKFVPASGAASRMFKHLFEFLDSPDPAAALADPKLGAVVQFLREVHRFAFYPALEQAVKAKGLDPENPTDPAVALSLISTLLLDPGLQYAALPKALILFHDYPEGARTAVEEHLAEAASYARNAGGTASVHFTLSPEHTVKFDELIRRKKSSYEEKLDTRFSIGWSVQKPSTDILAVDEENNPFRNPDGTLLFRPAGHGALLANLAELDADLIFIKNIDNIVPDSLRGPTVEYKQALAGCLLMAREKIGRFLAESGQNSLNEASLAEMEVYAETTLMIGLPESFRNRPAQDRIIWLMHKLDRPLRVCGMVKNEGEPGGGPFWVHNDDRTASLQIVESAQVDTRDNAQSEIFRHATHFNPVDLVCATRDFRGKPYDLSQFVDTNTGLISNKSAGGKTLKAQELPGLWNGSMADWITLFVEVPITTFSPVKSVNDLLRKEHQNHSSTSI